MSTALVPAALLLLLAPLAGCSRAQAEATTPEAGLVAPLAAFSHKVHAGDNEIGCGVCHPNARHAPVAGLASMDTCLGCHKFVAREKPDIQRLQQAFDAGRAIEWPRIHRLPDHVYFTHERHLARGLDCSACHGEMKTRTFAVQQQDLTMGFCMDCHRQKSAPTECNTCHK